MKTPWSTVAIVGVGLIGGSIGRALLARRLAGRVIGVGRHRESLAEAKRRRLVSETSLDLAAVGEAELVVVATGVGSIPRLLDAIDPLVEPGTILTDAGSTKAHIVAGWERKRKVRRARYVGSHPIAGSHLRGPAAADAKLFEGRVAVVTPAKATPLEDVEAVGLLWSSLGSTVFTMSPSEHDSILAATSHVPHLLAAAIAASTPDGHRRFAAGGWRDTTRVASGDPELWAEILLDNAAGVARSLSKVAGFTERLLTAIEAGDRRRLVALLSKAKDKRDALEG